MSNKHTFPVTVIFCAFGGGPSYSVNVECATASENVLNKVSRAWRATNHVDDSEPIRLLPVRSSSVGDILIVDGRHFIIDNTGFIEVSATVAIAWQAIDPRDVGMGWDWCVKHHATVKVGPRSFKLEGEILNG